MKGRKTSISLKCLTLAAAIAVLAAPPMQARAATGVGGPVTTRLTTEASSVTGSRHLNPNQGPRHGGKSYFWPETGIVAGVLAGTLLLGLWGDVAIGGIIFAVQALCEGAATAARKARAHAGKTMRPVVVSDTPSSEAQEQVPTAVN